MFGFINSRQSVSLSLIWLVFLFTYPTVSTPSLENSDPMASLVWVEVNDQGYNIFLSNLIGQTWSQPESLHSSRHELVTPAIISDQTGVQHLVWTEWKDDKGILKTKQNVLNEWTQEVVLDNQGTDNIAANLLMDLDGDIWLFWCKELEGDTQIFYRNKSPNSGWSQSSMAHPRNEVPDIRPESQINADGKIDLKWTSFDVERNQYIQQSRIIDPNVEGTIQNLSPGSQDAIVFEALEYPNFVPFNSAVYVYSKKNTFVQSHYLFPNS